MGENVFGVLAALATGGIGLITLAVAGHYNQIPVAPFWRKIALTIGILLVVVSIGFMVLPVTTPATAPRTADAPVLPLTTTSTPNASAAPLTATAVLPTNTARPLSDAPTTVMQSTPVQSGTSIRVSCDWADDWELQDDGTYLWTGSPPGTANCQNIGQRGAIYDRMQQEEITLVVNVGDTPHGLDICQGTFTATTVIPGETCTRNSEAWPKVSGTLQVTGSTGFLLGTSQ